MSFSDRQQLFITERIYNNDRLAIDALITEPNVMQTSSSNVSIQSTVMLMIKYNPPSSSNMKFTKEMNYKVTIKNHYKTLKFFNDILGWFYNKDLSDLFLKDENNRLIFNADYNKLAAFIKPDPFSEKVLKAVPSVIRFENGQEYEGIYLYINCNEFMVPLIINDLQDIVNVLKNFSYDAMYTKIYLSYTMSKLQNKIQKASYYKPYEAQNDQWTK